MSGAVLSSSGSLGQIFGRFGASVALGLVLGAALGGVLARRFGRTAYLPMEWVGFTVITAGPLLILAGVLAVSW